MLYVNLEDEHSVPDCVEQIEFKTVADKGTQTEEVSRHTLSKQKIRKTYLLKKRVKLKNAQIKYLKHYKKIFFHVKITEKETCNFLLG